jgi:hypothetical protein
VTSRMDSTGAFSQLAPDPFAQPSRRGGRRQKFPV